MRPTWISPLARIYGDVEIGDNCRIDDFVIITGNVKIGNHVHIGAFSFLAGGAGIVFEDFSGCSARISFFSASDDHGSGLSLVGPCIPEQYRPTIKRGQITLRKHAHIGAHSVILPGVEMGEGAIVGAMSLAMRDVPPWQIYAGTPAKYLKDRNRDIIPTLEQKFLEKGFEE